MATATETPRLVRAPTRRVYSEMFDSARWSGWKPRADDIVITTYAKSGTTWMQRIVHMLVFQSDAADPIASPWFDFRLMGPPQSMWKMAEGQAHRRFLKSHLPYDALPIYGDVKMIHVARDGRDAAMSLHNHFLAFSRIARRRYAEINEGDPQFDGATAEVSDDPALFFRGWLDGEGGRGDPGAGYFHVEATFWAERRNPNLLLVHYNDLKKDREGEMRRIARFLDIETPAPIWRRIVEAAGFEAMQRDGAALIPFVDQLWDGGAQRFIYKGTNGRWQSSVSADDLARYDAAVREKFSPALARWLEAGRLEAGDPETTA